MEQKTLDEKYIAGLNRLGSDGWELVSVVSEKTYIFKRPYKGKQKDGK